MPIRKYLNAAIAVVLLILSCLPANLGPKMYQTLQPHSHY